MKKRSYICIEFRHFCKAYKFLKKFRGKIAVCNVRGNIISKVMLCGHLAKFCEKTQAETDSFYGGNGLFLCRFDTCGNT